MSKRMTKRTRSLLYAVIALAVVGGLLAGLLLLLPKENDNANDDPVADESVVLFDKSDKKTVTLTSAVIAFADVSYTIEATDNDLYVVKGYEDLPLDHSLLSYTAESLLTVTASRLVIETPEKPADFGFRTTGNGIAVSATYSDDSSFAFEVGDLSPSGESYYVREVGKNAVYLVEQAFCETIVCEPTRYIDMMPVTAPTAEESTDTVVVRDVTLTGTVRPQTVYFQISEMPENAEENLVISGYAIQKPYFHAVDPNSPLITYSTFSALTASDVAVLRPTAANLATYGLSNPYSVCTVNLSLKRTTETKGENGETNSKTSYHSTFKHTIKLGKTDEDGNYYGVVYAEDTLIPVIYLFDPSAVSSWVDARYEDVADDMLYFQHITNLDSVSITDKGDAKTFSLKHIADEEDTDKNLTVTAGGKTYSTPDFRTLYSSLLSLYRAGATNETPTGTPLLTIQFTPMKQHGSATTVRIYEHTAGTCIAVHNSGEKHLLNAKDVQNLQAKYQKFLAGETIS